MTAPEQLAASIEQWFTPPSDEQLWRWAESRVDLSGLSQIAQAANTISVCVLPACAETIKTTLRVCLSCKASKTGRTIGETSVR